ncbi:hypothetical protein [Trinickia diaoshuihuensis]|uniref:hypothetical protein n=1 Tax=Trinickia diaoshuihuensis TaxID=2292265 RepID=UPI000E2721A9|nr:hypothetical protein [Trinickia diaoshuihuensis]
MALDTISDGIPISLYRPQAPAQPPQPATTASTPVSAPSVAPASANGAKPAQTTAGTPAPAVPDPGPQGIAQFIVKPGDSFWSLLSRQKVVDKNAQSDDALLKQNLAATPWLDPQAFGTRPGNGDCSLADMPPGATVTMLDPQRLGFLNEQRAALAAAPGLSNELSGPQAKLLSADEREHMVAPIAKPIIDEISYTLLKNGVVTDAQIDAVISTIAARAPNDRAFQQAIGMARVQVYAERERDGRTPDQVGKLQQDAAAGNLDKLKSDMREQLTAVAQAALAKSGGDSAQAYAAITARTGVYQTYFGTNNGDLVKDVAGDVQQQVLIKDPVQSVVDAYEKGLKSGGTRQAALDAAAQWQAVTDPKTKMPGQVSTIMTTLMDTRVSPSDSEPILKKIIDGLADGMTDVYGDNATFKTMDAVAAALQHTYDSDPPKKAGDKSNEPRPGQAIVDQLAGYLMQTFKSRQDVKQVVETNPSTLIELLQSGVQNDGDIALTASLAAQSNRAGDKLYTTMADSAIANGLDGYRKETLDPLATRTGMDAIAYTEGPKDWGNLNSPGQGQAALAALKTVPHGGDVYADIAQSGDAYDRLQHMKATLDRYAGDMRGPGFDKPVASPYWGSHEDDVTHALQEAIKAVPAPPQSGSAGDIDQTQWWWQKRVMTSAAAYYAEQAAQVLMVDPRLGGPSENFVNLFGDAEKNIEGKVTIAKNGLLGALFMLNGASVMSSLQTPSTDQRMNVDNALFAGLYTGAGVTTLLDGLAPGWKKTLFDTTAKGDAATLQRKMLETLLQKFDSWGAGDMTTKILKNSARTLLASTGDVATLVLAGGGLVPLFADPTTNPGHEGAYAVAAATDFGTAVAKQVLTTAAERVLAGGAGESAGEELLWGLAENGWKGVGIAGNIVASGIQYLANQYDLAHLGDKGVTQYLLALGVKQAVAEPFARHAMTLTSGVSAGPAINAYFRALGKGTPEMVAWMNTIANGHDADNIASYFKGISPGKDKDGHYVLNQTQLADIRTFLTNNRFPVS